MAKKFKMSRKLLRWSVKSWLRVLLILLISAALGVSTVTPNIPAYAQTNNTIIGSMTVVPTFECAGIIVSFTEDTDADNSVVMEYRLSGGGGWSATHPMYCDRTEKQWRGSIFWLTENTAYDVRVTFTDADGVTGTNPVTSVFNTMNSVKTSSGTNYFVATTGNDGTGDGTIGNPWLTVQYGVNQLSAGDILNIRGGTYNEMVTMAQPISGTANNYITVKAYNLEAAIIAAQEIRASCFVIQGDYVQLKDLTFKDSYGDSAVIVESASIGVVADNITIENPNIQGTAKYGFEISGGSYDVLLQNSTIIVNKGPAGLRGSIYGVGAYQAGARIVVRNNFMTGISGVSFRDGFADGPEDDSTTGNNWDIYDNEIIGAHDDGLQLEGGGINSRVWGNVITDSYVGLAFCPVLEGPAYIFRNVVFNNTALFTKMGDDSFGRIYFYHNSHWTAVGQGWSMTNANMNNVVSKNNIVRGGRYAVECGTISTPYDLDYNSYYSFDAARFAKWTGQRLLLTIAAWRAEFGVETHGRQGEPGLIEPVDQGVRLDVGSPCIDAGTTLVQFNDAASPWPFLDTAPDIGAKEYDSGAPANHAPVLGAIGSRTIEELQTLTFEIQGYDPDGDPVYYSASSLPDGATFNATTRVFDWTPTDNQSGVYNDVHFEVTDNTTTDSENITITVTDYPGGNSAPVLVAIGNKEIARNSLLEFTVNATDIDDDDMTYSASNLPFGAEFDSGTHIFSWTPHGAPEVGLHTDVFFEVSDGQLTDSENITITVTNTAPVLNAIGNKSVQAGNVLTFTATSSDNEADMVTYAMGLALPSGASFNEETGMFTWIPYNASSGNHSVQVITSDEVATDNETITITVSSNGGIPYWYVDDSVGASGSGTTPDSELKTIAEALAVAADNQEIGVAAGIYAWVPWSAGAIDSGCLIISSQDGLSIDTTDGSETATMMKTGTGNVTMGVALYSANPTILELPQSDTALYYDVYLSTNTGVTGVVAALSVPSEGTEPMAYWWDGSRWVLCSNQVYSGGTIAVTINNLTTPSLAQLSGDLFGVGSSVAATHTILLYVALVAIAAVICVTTLLAFLYGGPVTGLVAVLIGLIAFVFLKAVLESMW